MVKVVTALLSLAMIAHVIRPFGLPGLRRRADAWKIAAIAFLVVSLLAAFRP